MKNNKKQGSWGKAPKKIWEIKKYKSGKEQEAAKGPEGAYWDLWLS